MKEGGEETAWDAAAALQSDRGPDTRAVPINLTVFKRTNFWAHEYFANVCRSATQILQFVTSCIITSNRRTIDDGRPTTYAAAAVALNAQWA